MDGDGAAQEAGRGAGGHQQKTNLLGVLGKNFLPAKLSLDPVTRHITLQNEHLNFPVASFASVASTSYDSRSSITVMPLLVREVQFASTVSCKMRFYFSLIIFGFQSLIFMTLSRSYHN